jgi:hypothetical protein
MVLRSIIIPRAISASAWWSAMPRFAHKAAEAISDFSGVAQNLALDIRDSYRPELHYMRGPGPKWLAKHKGFR